MHCCGAASRRPTWLRRRAEDQPLLKAGCLGPCRIFGGVAIDMQSSFLLQPLLGQARVEYSLESALVYSDVIGVPCLDASRAYLTQFHTSFLSLSSHHLSSLLKTTTLASHHVGRPSFIGRHHPYSHLVGPDTATQRRQQGRGPQAWPCASRRRVHRPADRSSDCAEDERGEVVCI